MMKKKLILISGSPCVGKTAVGEKLFESYDNSAYLDGDWCWCVHPFSVTDSRLRNGDKGETNYFWLHLPPCPGDIVIDTDNKSIRDVVKEMKKQIDSAGNETNH